MFNFIIQNNHIYSDITGIMMDPAIIISIDKDTKDVTWQKIGNYHYLRENDMTRYSALRDTEDVVLLALNTMSLDKHQQCILLNHLVNCTLNPLIKRFVQQYFSNDIDGCRNTVNDMYHINNPQTDDVENHAAESDANTLQEQMTITRTQWEQSFDAFKAQRHTSHDIKTLVQAGLNVFDGSVDGKLSDKMLTLFNKARNGKTLAPNETNLIQTYYKTIEQDNFHTELQATEIYTNVDYV